mmetsp:Transcript_7892/g.24360  ORF Transcript_7892/g.24360 Transcript_7892/m.24360 type:complete len:407 (+) Transcript_7892:1440-2660(+)
MHHLLATEALGCQMLLGEGTHQLVVELEPARFAAVGRHTLLDEAVVVAGLGHAAVDQHTFQLVLVVLGRMRYLLGGRHTRLLPRLAAGGSALSAVVIAAGTLSASAHSGTAAALLLHFVLLTVGRLLLALESGQALSRVRLHADGGRELAVGVELLVAHRVKVEVEALQMKEERGRQLGQAGALERVAFLVALLAVVGVVALQPVALHVRLERLLQRVLALHLDGDGVERFHALAAVRATLADQLTDQLALPDVLHQVLLRGALERALHLVAQVVEELVHVHLHCGVGGSTLRVLVGLAEGRRIVVLLLALLQVAEHQLHLVHEIVGQLLAALLAVLQREDAAPEAGHHEQLLQQRDHVADTAQVADAHVADLAAPRRARQIAPLARRIAHVPLAHQTQQVSAVLR